MARRSHEETEHRTGGARSLKARSFPYIWHWIMAFAVVPGVATGLWLLGQRDPALRALVTFLDVLATWALVTFIFRLAEHAGRKPIIAWHVAGTVFGVGFTWGLTTVFGWSPAWALIYFFAACVGAGSWNAHRIDALRSRSDEKGDNKGWAEVLGMPHVRAGKPKAVDAGVAVTVTAEPGGTVADVQAALSKIEAAAPGALPGRSRVVQDPTNAPHGELTLVYQDVLRTWQPWPGPSALGGSIAQPVVTGYYEDGAAQRYWFCAGLTDEGEPRIGTHVGRMGMTGAAKTGDAKTELAELMTRRDVVVFAADATKGAQTMGPLMGGLTLLADTKPKVRVLFAGLRQLVRDRADRLGAAGYADWTPECATDARLRMPAVVQFVDEADELITDPKFVWLATKARSTGVFLSVTLPRADHASMPPTARFSIGAWKCFGTGDDYSAEFALTDETRKAGAHPENWRNTRPGYHFLDTAPGVDQRLYPVPCRSYLHTDMQIEAAVTAGAPYRMGLPAEDIASLGDAWTYCQPGDARRPGAQRPPTGPPPGPNDGEDDEDMDDIDEDLDLTRVMAAGEDAEPGDTDDYAEIDPSRPLPPYHGPNLPIDDGKPEAVSQEEAVRAFDALLVEMAGEGKTEATVAEFADRYRYRLKPWVSRRLIAIAEGAVVSPPGLTLQRKPDGPAGHYLFIRLNGGSK
jgi:hypothetical protein